MSDDRLATLSDAQFRRAQRLIPGGVNSPVRAFKAVGGVPRFIARAEGPYLFDIQGASYIDLICSWGAVLLGHADADINEVLRMAAQKGMSYGAPTVVEVEMAEKLSGMMPTMEMIRMVNSGTEATMSALRLARAQRERAKIVKFTGCYHGHSDCLLAGAGSGMLTLSIASSPGVPQDMIKDTHNLAFNDSEQLHAYFKQCGDQTAAIIVEPMAGNMNFVPADEEFLQTARALCDKHGALLIFDEVMTGFRVARGGAQSHYGVRPDLTCLGKVIGGGLPIGAFGGRRAVMQHLAPSGKVYQAGTLSGNPITMAVGLHILRRLDDEDLYTDLHQRSATFAKRLGKMAAKAGLKLSAAAHGGMLGIYCGLNLPPRNYDEAAQMDLVLFKQLFHQLLKLGVHLPPSAYEAAFISLAHTPEVMRKVEDRFDAAFTALARAS